MCWPRTGSCETHRTVQLGRRREAPAGAVPRPAAVFMPKLVEQAKSSDGACMPCVCTYRDPGQTVDRQTLLENILVTDLPSMVTSHECRHRIARKADAPKGAKSAPPDVPLC